MSKELTILVAIPDGHTLVGVKTEDNIVKIIYRSEAVVRPIGFQRAEPVEDATENEDDEDAVQK
jgi:hypothetical protein